MSVITVSGHEPGDYLHPDQKLEIVEESSGQRYEILLRGSNTTSQGKGEISIFLPIVMLRDVQANGDYCVVTLSPPRSPDESAFRRKSLAGMHVEGDLSRGAK